MLELLQFFFVGGGGWRKSKEKQKWKETGLKFFPSTETQVRYFTVLDGEKIEKIQERQEQLKHFYQP